MGAPDKIYITPVGTYDTKHVPDLQDNIYIRKDYLLEWLDGKLTIEGATEGYVGGYDSALKDVIDKLNEL